jgi:hypothetical protein
MQNTIAGATKSPPASVAVASSATSIIAATSRRMVILSNNGGVTVYLGSTSAVTTTNGIALAAGAVFIDDVTGDAWYGIVASGTCNVGVTSAS